LLQLLLVRIPSSRSFELLGRVVLGREGEWEGGKESVTDHTFNRLGVSFWRRRKGGREGGKESVIAHTVSFLGEEKGRGGGRERGCV